jgi:sugar lactone lactonase YvrE
VVRSGLLLLAALSGCTFVNPFGLECVSDQNCGCANCCIAYRCTMLGPQVMADAGGLPDGGDVDGGTLVWRVSTFAGGTRGTLDGQGSAAQFDDPSGMAIDSAGTLYVADTNNNCVRTISPSGLVGTLAPAVFPCGGTGLVGPQGVAVDSSGTVYIASTGENCIRRVTSAGQADVLAGSCTQQSNECLNTPNPPRFSRPFGLALTPQYLFVTEVSANHVRWVKLSDRTVGTLTGQGFGTAVRVDGTCGYANQYSGSPSGATFYGPAGIAEVGAGTLFVTDVYNCALRKIVIEPGCAVITLGRAGCPMFVSENTTGILRNAFGIAAGDGPLTGVAVAADTGNQRVVLVAMDGVLTPIAGTGMRGSADGLGSEATFQTPTGVAVDSMGRIFISDSGNHRVRVLTQERR